MAQVSFQVERAEWQEAVRNAIPQGTRLLAQVLEMIGWETVSWLRSHTDKMRPPIRKGLAERPAHPGEWADVSGDLARAYRFEIWAGLNRVRWSAEGEAVTVRGVIPRQIEPTAGLTLFIVNSWAYAAALEAKNGYWVVSGVGDENSPVFRALYAAIAAMPEWTIE